MKAHQSIIYRSRIVDIMQLIKLFAEIVHVICNDVRQFATNKINNLSKYAKIKKCHFSKWYEKYFKNNKVKFNGFYVIKSVC